MKTPLLFSCRTAAEAISQSQDERLPVLKRLQVRLHLLICKHCRRYAHQVRLLRSFFHSYPDHMDACLSTEVVNRIVTRLRNMQH